MQETSKLKDKKNFFLLLFVLHASNPIFIAFQVIKDMLKVNILFLNLFAQLSAKAKCKRKTLIKLSGCSAHTSLSCCIKFCVHFTKLLKPVIFLSSIQL